MWLWEVFSSYEILAIIATSSRIAASPVLISFGGRPLETTAFSFFKHNIFVSISFSEFDSAAVHQSERK